MAVALRELDRGTRRRAPRLRVVPEPAQRRRPTPVRMYRRRRLAVLLALLVLTALVVGAVAADRTAASGGATGPTTTVTVVIGPGETMWDVAGRYLPAGEDKTSWLARVAADNGVDASAIRPGTAIRVPVEGESVVAEPAPVSRAPTAHDVVAGGRAR